MNLPIPQNFFTSLTDWKAKHAAGNVNQGDAENLSFKQPKLKVNRLIRLNCYVDGGGDDDDDEQ